MAKPILRGGKYYVKVRDEAGRWRRKVTAATSHKEAERIRVELQLQADRRRDGLEPMPARTRMTLGELMRWWLDTYSARAPSRRQNESAVRVHILPVESLSSLPLQAVTPGKLETFLQAKSDKLGPQSLNHLRGFIGRAFSAAQAAELWPGENPVRKVKKRRVPRRAPEFLRFDEVPAVLAALSSRWRPLFATAIYAGLRKGELRALRKIDVDLENRLLRVARSGDRDTTKGGHADYVSMNKELVVFLEEALAASPSEFVFPDEDGNMQSAKTKWEVVLRRAMLKAGIVTGFEHVCRRKGCGTIVKAADDTERRCPRCDYLLWVRATVRPVRFHDLRHTTASLSLMSGADLVAVQALMRHDDPKTTMGTYGHLARKFLRDEVDKLSFGPPTSSGDAVSSTDAKGFGPPLVQGSENRFETPEPPSATLNDPATMQMRARRESNPRPAASKAALMGIQQAAASRKCPKPAGPAMAPVPTRRSETQRIPIFLLPRLLPPFSTEVLS